MRSKKLIVALSSTAFLLTACPDSGGPPDSMEEAGEAVDEAIEEAGDAVEDAADEVEDAVDQ